MILFLYSNLDTEGMYRFDTVNFGQCLDIDFESIRGCEYLVKDEHGKNSTSIDAYNAY